MALDDDLDKLLVTGHWECVTLNRDHIGELIQWCKKQGWRFGVDYYISTHDFHPMFTTEWGRFNLDKSRKYNFLFKNEKHATMFRLYCSSQ
jgi:hypothetical protein